MPCFRLSNSPGRPDGPEPEGLVIGSLFRVPADDFDALFQRRGDHCAVVAALERDESDIAVLFYPAHECGDERVLLHADRIFDFGVPDEKPDRNRVFAGVVERRELIHDDSASDVFLGQYLKVGRHLPRNRHGPCELLRRFAEGFQIPRVERHHRGEITAGRMSGQIPPGRGSMTAAYPDIEQLDRVTRAYAEAYIQQLRENGRFVRKVTYLRDYQGETIAHSYDAQSRLPGRTVNAFHKTLKSVFAKLQENTGILYNPFNFDMMDNDSESRDAFTPAELKLIGDNLDSFVRPLFIVGTCTGLFEGDICTLRREDIRDERWIVRKRRKTSTALEIPILPPLANFLHEQKKISFDNEYVLSEHAEMYHNNPSGISYRIKSFLERLGIQTTRSPKPFQGFQRQGCAFVAPHLRLPCRMLPDSTAGGAIDSRAYEPGNDQALSGSCQP